LASLQERTFTIINSFWAIVRRCSWELPPAAGPQERLRQTAPADAMVRRQRSNKKQHMKSCKINNGFFSGGALVKISVWNLAKSTLDLSREERQKTHCEILQDRSGINMSNTKTRSNQLNLSQESQSLHGEK
jgi:hypothetical protein